MLTKLSFPRLQNAEAILYAERLLGRIVPDDALPVPVQSAKNRFAELISEMNDLVQRTAGSRFTDDLAATDALRDEYVSALFLLCQGHGRCEHAGRRAAGALLLEALEAYGPASDLIRTDGDKETKLIENLGRDLQARDDLRNALRTCGIESLLEALRTENNNFVRLMEAQSDDELTKPEANRMVALRREAASAYRLLMQQVESAYNFTGGAAPWVGIAGALNQITEEFIQKLAQRAGRAAAAKPPEPAAR